MVTTLDEADRKARLERARETGLFRYSLVQELAEPGLSPAERGRRARELAGRVHDGPGGQPAAVSRGTLDRWRRAYEAGGFDALVPSLRQPAPRTPQEVLAVAEALKREKPERTAAQVLRILQLTSGWAPSDRTLQRLFERLELNAPAPGPQEEQQALGRFECARPNEMWTGDTLHGPVIAGGKSYLFTFIDDHSRAVMGARWAYHDDVVRMAAAFRPALQRRGVPRAIYLDNGSPFVDAWLLRGCAVLGIKLIHSRPGKPEGRGKIERFFRTVRDQFLVEVGTGQRIGGLAEMNRLFQSWVEASYHQAVHSETGEEPIARWARAAPSERAVPEPGAAAGGVPVVGAAPGGQDRPGLAARQLLPGRRVAGREVRRAGLRPVRPGPDRGPARRQARRDRCPVYRRAAPPPQDPDTGRRAAGRAGPDRDRLPRRPRRQPRRRAERAGLLPVPHRGRPGGRRQEGRRP
jgi:putative transposase